MGDRAASGRQDHEALSGALSRLDRLGHLCVALRASGNFLPPGQPFIEPVREGRRITLACPGDSREIGKPTVRQIRRELELDSSPVFDAATFYGSCAAVEKFIEDYLEVFRDLATR
jgi:hypothetical protein